jgi:nucleotide-binding universal stress UspA family protein
VIRTPPTWARPTRAAAAARRPPDTGPGAPAARAARPRPRPEDVTGTLAFAFEEAALRGADLVAVHTWYWLPSAPGQAGALRPADPERFAAEAAQQLTAALEDWHDKYPDVRVRQDVTRGHPGRVLASYSARADLVVLGRHGHPAGPGPGIGSVQHAVLDHAHGPVAIVPSGD